MCTPGSVYLSVPSVTMCTLGSVYLSVPSVTMCTLGSVYLRETLCALRGNVYARLRVPP
jgi:hypothetical protein